jgi:heparan-alpha-glucosaminide N-acetyltransferase
MIISFIKKISSLIIKLLSIGITIADFVFPWFIYLMGFSIPLSMNSMLNKPNVKRLEILKKVLIRFIKMFAIGIMLNTRYGVRLNDLRIFGVLQRIALCYLVVSILELIFYRPIKTENLKGFKYYFADLLW